MKVRLIWGNYVSGDLKKTADFYTALGFKRNSNMEDGEFVSFTIGETSLFVLNFFTEKRLSDRMNGGLSIPKSSNELIFSLSADSEEEVDQWAEKVKAAGGEVFPNLKNSSRDIPLHFQIRMVINLISCIGPECKRVN